MPKNYSINGNLSIGTAIKMLLKLKLIAGIYGFYEK